MPDPVVGDIALFFLDAEGVGDTETPATRTSEYLKQHTLAETDDRFVMVFGSPLGESGATNSIRVERVR